MPGSAVTVPERRLVPFGAPAARDNSPPPRVSRLGDFYTTVKAALAVWAGAGRTEAGVRELLLHRLDAAFAPLWEVSRS